MGTLVLLVVGGPTVVALGVAVLFAPFTLVMALRLTAFLACGVVSLSLGDHRERAEVLVCAISSAQPPSAGERYREAMLAEVRAAAPDQVEAIRTNLVATAPRIILAAWVRLPRAVIGAGP